MSTKMGGMTYRFSEGRQLFRLFPAKDVEAVGEGEEEEDIRYDKYGEGVQFTLNFIRCVDYHCAGICERMVTVMNG